MSSPLNYFVDQTIGGFTHSLAGKFATDPCEITYRVDNGGTWLRQADPVSDPLTLELWSVQAADVGPHTVKFVARFEDTNEGDIYGDTNALVIPFEAKLEACL